MATPINTIYSWFETGDFPTQEQFHASWSSFWHKDETIPMTTIDGLSDQFGKYVLVSTFNSHLNDENAHSTYLAKRDASNLTPTNVNDWKAKLGVGDLPENIATYDYDIHNQVMMKDGTTKEATDLGKNVANSSLTSVAGAGLTLGSSWTLDTNGQPYSITNLPDKSADIAFQEMLVQNSYGQVAKGNGKFLAQKMPSLLSDTEKTTWKTEMNGGWTTNTMSVGLINPPIINNSNNNIWVLLKGTNLNLSPTNFKIEIMNEAGTTVLATVPNSQVQLYQNGTDLVFYYNFSNLSLGKYKIRLWNGVAYYVTPMLVELVANVITFDLSKLIWQTKIYSDLIPKNISISPSNVSMSSDLKNIDGSEFDEAQISTGTVVGTVQSNAAVDVNGVPITWNDDFYISFDLNCQKYARAGAGITNNNVATLTPATILGLWTDDGNWQTATTTAGNTSERPSNTYGFNLTITKRGSIATLLLQGQTMITLASTSTINTSENVYFKFFKYINRAPITALGDINGIMIKEAYKI
ncbi:hypothetical protein EGH90_12265 [Kaistella haifensis]|nr:hypothetical protein EGH90_12265 [Kaistella haifensis]